jgi:hypothetical protein
MTRRTGTGSKIAGIIAPCVLTARGGGGIGSWAAPSPNKEYFSSLLFVVRTMSVIKYSAGHRPVAKRSKQPCERPNAFADGPMAGASRRGGSASWTRVSARTSVVRLA